ncbi:hypothetical protein DYE50_07420 [Treponema ruminis]|uniref:Uncharacterized protein n=1 Tax=Treponema ruminis TaxID=744515 RepID=A0A7W8LLQ9_9SPIR|nr:hypothetical protein [Treponema ruminis]MBB5225706.1 hypothetical protein [Treponema ruminis]QSI02395.1 hypothetical protein DYE50_07420 [Treponema ruminis]
MSDRNSHSGKSKPQRDFYQRSVARSEYEETTNESLDFDKSDSTRILDNPNDDTVQKAPFTSKVGDFCKEHVAGIVATIISAIVIGIFSLLTINLNRESGEHSRDISNIKETVSELKEDLSSTSATVNNMQVQNAEQAKDIEFIQKSIEKMDKEIDKIQDSIIKK